MSTNVPVNRVLDIVRKVLSAATLVLFASFISEQRENSCVATEPTWSPEATVKRIDEIIQKEWTANRLAPSPRSSDTEFCRRVWLDLAGVAPSIGDLRRFLEDASTDKRAKLVDQLLASPLHAKHMAATWLNILLKEGSNDPSGNALPLEEWLRQQFLANTRYDTFVAEFMTAGGLQNIGPAAFFTSLDLKPERVAAETSRIFLGLELQCAQCHDHPTEHWRQTDFWNYAAFFSQLERSEPNMGGQVYLIDRSNRELTLPDTDTVAPPRYPGVEDPPEPDIDGNRRRQLTVWMASRDNRFLIHTAVDRVWSHLLSQPDLSKFNPELADLLAEEFVQHRFDLRKLYAIVARTAAYNRTSRLASNDDVSEAKSDPITAMPAKTLTARQYYDSLIRNIYRQPPVVGYLPEDSEAVGRLRQRFLFLNRMRTSNSGPTEYPHGLVQSLGLLNGPEIAQVTRRQSSGLLSAIQSPFLNDSQRIEVLYLSTLSRMPETHEAEQCLGYLVGCEGESERADVFADILWTLLNTTECMLCP